MRKCNLFIQIEIFVLAFCIYHLITTSAITNTHAHTYSYAHTFMHATADTYAYMRIFAFIMPCAAPLSNTVFLFYIIPYVLLLLLSWLKQQLECCSLLAWRLVCCITLRLSSSCSTCWWWLSSHFAIRWIIHNIGFVSIELLMMLQPSNICCNNYFCSTLVDSWFSWCIHQCA